MTFNSVNVTFFNTKNKFIAVFTAENGGIRMTKVNYKKLDDKQKYSRWYNMNSRCYRECYHRTHPGTIYPECEVCEDWRIKKESFYDWLDKEYYTVGGEQMDIDKDILKKGNRLYSPETCLVVPHTINVLWAMLPASYPTFNEERQQWEADAEFFPTPYSQKKYFDDLEEAWDYMAGIKYAHIKEVAELYKDEMPEKIYQAMLAYRIDQEDWEAWEAA